MTNDPYSEAAWREIYKSPGSVGLCRSPQWLRNGCPKCGCKTWQVTSDCHAYCDGCGKGFATEYPFTASGSILSILDENGVRDWEEWRDWEK
jgi:hypothetical protein